MNNFYPNHDHSTIIFQCPLCSSVPEERQEEFLGDVRFSLRTYEKGDVVVTQGSRYESLYIVIL